jgi:hypothetical protein
VPKERGQKLRKGLQPRRAITLAVLRPSRYHKAATIGKAVLLHLPEQPVRSRFIITTDIVGDGITKQESSNLHN